MAAPPAGFVGYGMKNEMVQKIELRISCRNLPNKDTTSKSDPCAVVYFKQGEKYKEIARTENVKNSLDPDFSTPIAIDYHFECVQHVRIRVYDLDNTTEKLGDDDFLGQLEATLAQIVSKSPFTKTLTKKKGEPIMNASITITAEEVKEGTELALMTFKAKKLENKVICTAFLVQRAALCATCSASRDGNQDKVRLYEPYGPSGCQHYLKLTRNMLVKNYFLDSAIKKFCQDFLGKSDPFLEISRLQSNGSWLLVHRTEVVQNDLSPQWRPFELRVSSLCGIDKSQPIKFAVFDWDGDGGHDFIGGFSATLDEMSKAMDSEVSWPCINEAKKEKKKNYKDSGTVILSSLKFQREHSFLDYIFGGLQINMTIGVDFTGSNGNASDPRSLHYYTPQYPNEYMQAISAVGSVLQDYDTDKMFPALGFGAGIPPHNQVSFEFPLNFNFQNPFCAGIQGVLDAYTSCLSQINFYGPTNVAPIINHIARFAHAAQQSESQTGAGSYYILLLLTDGILSDMDEVRNALVAASSLPLSLIIVGVGQADFSDMNALDGDDGVLKSTRGVPVQRDIVQFVPFSQFKATHPAELARHVLAEVPSQVTSYFRKRSLPPRSQALPQSPPQ